MTGKVIILNGVSSAGKSSLARAIQKTTRSTFLHVEMDTFISFLPQGHEFRPEWFKIERITTPVGNLPRISNGPRGKALLRVMRAFVFDAANEGLDMIVDEVCQATEIDQYRSGLSSYEAHVVKVFAQINVIEEREKARGDRLIGLARGQADHLHEGIEYDAEIDTSSAPPQQLAAQLVARFDL